MQRHTNTGAVIANDSTISQAVPAGQPSAAAPVHPLTAQDATVWLIGLGGTWIILTFLAEFDSTRELSVALGVVLLGSVLALHGKEAFTNLGVI